MIADIVFDWNVLTATVVAWAAVLSLTLGIDFGPSIYRERKARATIMEGLAVEAENRRYHSAQYIPHDETMALFIIQQPTTTRRKHAKV